jgi:hypothetical protein
MPSTSSSPRLAPVKFMFPDSRRPTIETSIHKYATALSGLAQGVEPSMRGESLKTERLDWARQVQSMKDLS